MSIFLKMLFPLQDVLYQCDSNYLAVHIQVQLQSLELQCLLPATPNSHPTFGQQILKPIAGPHEISACKSNMKAPLEAVQLEIEAPLEAVPMEVEPFKVDKPKVRAFHFVGVSSLPLKCEWKCSASNYSFCVCFRTNPLTQTLEDCCNRNLLPNLKRAHARLRKWWLQTIQRRTFQPCIRIYRLMSMRVH